MAKKRIFEDSPSDKEFVLKDGSKVKNLVELSKALHYMDDALFRFHVTAHKNDFAKWVNDVFKQKRLAKELGESKNKYDHQLIILKHGINKHVRGSI